MGLNHRIDDAGELVCCGRDGQLWAVFGLDSAIVGSRERSCCDKGCGQRARRPALPDCGFLLRGSEDSALGVFDRVSSPGTARNSLDP